MRDETTTGVYECGCRWHTGISGWHWTRIVDREDECIQDRMRNDLIEAWLEEQSNGKAAEGDF